MRVGRLWNTGWLLLSLASLFWAGNAVVGRGASELIPPIGLAFWRWVLATIALLPLAWPHVKRDWPVLVKAWPLVALLAFLGLAGFNAIFYTALHSTTAINSVLLQSATPPLILLFSFFLFRERVGLNQIAGLVVAIAGVVEIVTEGRPLSVLQLRLNIGDALVLVCVAFYALYSALLRKKPAVHPLSFLFGTFVASVVMLLPPYVLEHLSGEAVEPTPPVLLALGYVALFPSILAYLFFNRGVELMGANRAGQFVHLMPGFGALLSVMFLGEALRPFHGVGMALILAGIVLSSMGPKKVVEP